MPDTWAEQQQTTSSFSSKSSPAASHTNRSLARANMEAFHRFRPTSHFIAPHSWSNDPCGAVYIPETQEYLLCYQWNPGTTVGGNCAWGMAKSKDLVTWEDCPPPIWNGATYDNKGVFSGSIESTLVEGKRVLLLFYTSVSALPIHWSQPYIHGCESQSVAISTDYGRTWHRHSANPLLSRPPKGPATTGWRDPFVSQWPFLSKFISLDESTNYMLIASGERQRGPQLHMYTSCDLLNWDHLSVLLDVKRGSKVSEHSPFSWGVNFECASFFSLEETGYLIVGVEEEADSPRHNGHYLMWMSGTLVLQDSKPRFEISSHGMLDHGVSYAAHIFRDAQGRLLQLGWADETAKASVITSQGWAGCLSHPRELFQLTKPLTEAGRRWHEWTVDEGLGLMSTLGIRPAPQVVGVRDQSSFASLESVGAIRSTSFEVRATFAQLTYSEKFVFNVRASPDLAEVTRLVIDLENGQICIDRSRSSLANLGTQSPDVGRFHLLPGEDLEIRLFVDNSIVEVFANERFSMTSRVYPSLDSSTGVSHDFGDFDTNNVTFECWERLRRSWPGRDAGYNLLRDLHPLQNLNKRSERVHVSELPVATGQPA
jgi:beta-fructofuranosidase